MAATACADDDTEPAEPANDTAPTEPGRGGPEVTDVAELSEELDAAGMECELEYEGLEDDTGQREMSRCTIGDDQVTLTVWSDLELLDAFVESEPTGSGATAVGPNWTIDTAELATAEEIAADLGGMVWGD